MDGEIEIPARKTPSWDVENECNGFGEIHIESLEFGSGAWNKSQIFPQMVVKNDDEPHGRNFKITKSTNKRIWETSKYLSNSGERSLGHELNHLVICKP